MEFKLVLHALNELSVLFCCLIGLYWTPGLQFITIIASAICICVSFGIWHLKQRDIWYLKYLLLGIQLGINCELSQFALLIWNLLLNYDDIQQNSRQRKLILFIVILYNATHNQSNNFLKEVPMVLLLAFDLMIEVICELELYLKLRNTIESKDLFNEQTFKQQKSLEKLHKQLSNAITPNIGGDANGSYKEGSELNQIQLMTPISHNNLMRINDDDLIMQHMSWIQSQPVLVYNEQLDIVYQSIFLGKFLKQQTTIDKGVDLQMTFLQSVIQIGSRELNELSSVNGLANDSIFSDGSYLQNTINDNHRCKLRQSYSVREMADAMLKDFQRWRCLTVMIYKMKNPIMDFNNLQVKVFIMAFEEKNFVFFLFETQAIVQKHSHIDINQQYINIFTTFLQESINYTNCIQTMTLISLHDMGIKGQRMDAMQNYAHPMRMASLRFNLFLNSMRDYIFYLQNQLFVRISQFKIQDLVEDILMIYEDHFKLRDISLVPTIDLNEATSIVFTDFDRIKQILSCLLTYCLRYTTAGQLKLDIKSFTVSGIMISIKDSTIGKDENAKKMIAHLIKQLNGSLKSSRTLQELDLNNPLELQICTILTYQLSGSFKKGLDFLYDSNGYGTFTFVIESQNTSKNNSHRDTGPIKILGQKKYYETSLSMILALDSSQYGKDESNKQFSLTQFSKQFSMKQGEPPDMQSAYFSQISRIQKQDTQQQGGGNSNSVARNSKEQSQSFSGTQKWQQDSLLQQPTLTKNQFIPPKTKLSSNCKSESANESARSFIDFGFESSNPSIHPPELLPKLLNTVIKFKLRLDCCSKVLIVDNDHYSVLVLQMVLAKYNIKCDKAFNGRDAQEYIAKKLKNPCRCKNTCYLLYFIELNLPIMSGIDFVKFLKDQMRKNQIDKGFAIAMTTFVDLNAKLECFRSGMDYFISKPFDLVDISAAVQYLDF